ncbi:hypothetical protein GOODEAATRI_008588, partial [Goodea atripinnis]
MMTADYQTRNPHTHRSSYIFILHPPPLSVFSLYLASIPPPNIKAFFLEKSEEEEGVGGVRERKRRKKIPGLKKKKKRLLSLRLICIESKHLPLTQRNSPHGFLLRTAKDVFLPSVSSVSCLSPLFYTEKNQTTTYSVPRFT